MTAESFSAMHRLFSDALWHYHAGALAILLQLQPNRGAHQSVIIESDMLAGQHVQWAVSAGTWMVTRHTMGTAHDWSLLDNVVTPGFEYDDYEAGIRDELNAPSFAA